MQGLQNIVQVSSIVLSFGIGAERLAKTIIFTLASIRHRTISSVFGKKKQLLS